MSISTIAITIVGTVSPISAPVVAQGVFRCSRQTPQEGSRLPGNVPRDVRLQAQAAANAVPEVPDVTLTHFSSKIENSVKVWKLNGRRSDNGCLLKVDVISTAPSSDTQANVKRIERQLPIVSLSTLRLLPILVRSRLRDEGFTAATFQLTYPSYSSRATLEIHDFVPPAPVPPFPAEVQTAYSFQGTCTANIPPYCTVGVKGEVKISADGTSFLFKRAI